MVRWSGRLGRKDRLKRASMRRRGRGGETRELLSCLPATHSTRYVYRYRYIQRAAYCSRALLRPLHTNFDRHLLRSPAMTSLSDDEIDFDDPRFLIDTPKPAQELTYAEKRRKTVAKSREAGQQRDPNRSRKQLEEETREEGLRRNLIASDTLGEATAGESKALKMMKWVDFRGLSRRLRGGLADHDDCLAEAWDSNLERDWVASALYHLMILSTMASRRRMPRPPRAGWVSTDPHLLHLPRPQPYHRSSNLHCRKRGPSPSPLSCARVSPMWAPSSAHANEAR